MRVSKAAGVLGMLVLAACGSSASGPGNARELNIYAWSDYFSPDIIADFEKETGIKTRLVTFPSLEVLETTLLVGGSKYDVAVVAANMLNRMIKANALLALDRSKLPQWANLDSDILSGMAVQDPGNRFAVPFMWGATGIGLDERKIRQLDPSAPIDSWNLVFDPKEIAKFASCGISIVDSPNDVVAGALLAAGKNPNSASVDDLNLAERRLLAIRPFVRKIDGDGQISDLANNDICLMVTWTSNVVQARRRAAEVGNHTDFRFVIPREGTVTFVDALALPADAPHSKAALQFVDFLMRPDIAARSANFLGNASANKAALDRIEKLQREDAAIYPDPETRRRLQPLLERSDESARVVTRLWTRFKTGQ